MKRDCSFSSEEEMGQHFSWVNVDRSERLDAGLKALAQGTT